MDEPEDLLRLRRQRFVEMGRRRVAAGLCRQCGEPRNRGTALCDRHLDDAAKRERLRRIEEDDGSLTLRPGVCFDRSEVAELMGLSVSQVRQLERRALYKIQRHPVAREAAVELGILPEVV